jgi:polysaccharide export outer membrane protein
MTVEVIPVRLHRLVSKSLWIFLAFWSVVPPVLAQTGSIYGPSNPKAPATEDYEIGPGDVLSISVTDAPEFTGKFRVDQSGLLAMSSLASPLKAQGKTPIQLALDLRVALEEAKLYRNPTINVFVDEYHSRTVTVVGAVAKPAVYPLEKRTTLVEMISQAGLLPNSGNKVTVKSTAGESPYNPEPNLPVQTFDLTKLLRADDAAGNVEVHDGDVVTVSAPEVVYVVGAVMRPGGFVVQDQSAGVTTLQAIALAEGLSPTASSHHVLIIRRSPDRAAPENIFVDLAKISAGKIPDPQLEANDVLFVPVSGSKQTVHAMGQVAMSAVNGIAIYGVGYRVGSIH